MKYFFLTILVVAILAGVWFFGRESAEPAMTADLPVGKAGLLAGQPAEPAGPTATINGHVLELEVMRTPEEQQRGLSGREALADNAGMLFAYEKPAVPGFWMPNMNFSIDIIWIGADNELTPEQETRSDSRLLKRKEMLR